MNELVSVIVPVYNAEKYLAECLESIINQKYEYLDIVIVNDGSTDSSRHICERYAKKDNRIRIIDKENGGNGDARNVGVENAKGEWIIWVDADDVIHPEQINILYEIAKKRNIDIVVGNYLSFSDSDKLCMQSLDDKWNNKFELLNQNHLYNETFIKQRSMILTVPWCKLCHKKVFQGVKYALKKKNVDTWTTWKLYENATSVAFVDVILYFWRNNKDSLTNEKFSKDSFNAIEAYLYQMEYFYSHNKKRLFEIVFDEGINEFFWCYNRVNKELALCLKEYFDILRKYFGYIRMSKGVNLKKYCRYVYLMYYKIPKLLNNIL